MKKQIHKLNLFLRGWGNCFLIANAYQLTVELDSWIRRRLRISFRKQKMATMAETAHPSESVNLTWVNERLAIACGITRKGPCRSSKKKRDPDCEQ